MSGTGTVHSVKRPLNKRNDSSLLRCLVRRPEVAGRRVRAAHSGQYGIDQHRCSDNNPTDIQPELIHDILLWLKVVRGIGPICWLWRLVQTSRAGGTGTRR